MLEWIVLPCQLDRSDDLCGRQCMRDAIVAGELRIWLVLSSWHHYRGAMLCGQLLCDGSVSVVMLEWLVLPF
jgi:hypothetical protein